MTLKRDWFSSHVVIFLFLRPIAVSGKQHIYYILWNICGKVTFVLNGGSEKFTQTVCAGLTATHTKCLH